MRGQNNRNASHVVLKSLVSLKLNGQNVCVCGSTVRAREQIITYSSIYKHARKKDKGGNNSQLGPRELIRHSS
jgi:hypothetical protein